MEAAEWVQAVEVSEASDELLALQAIHGDNCRVRMHDHGVVGRESSGSSRGEGGGGRGGGVGGVGGSDGGMAVCVEVDLTPLTAEDATQQFVAGTLEIVVPNTYPSSSSAVHLALPRGVKGMSERRQAELLLRLREFVASPLVVGGPVLVALVEHAKDVLTGMNAPEGSCCFCLEPLVSFVPRRPEEEECASAAPTSAAAEAATAMDVGLVAVGLGSGELFKLMGCLHCFHSGCVVRWWQWQKEADRTREQQQRRQQHLQAKPAAALCPVCRTPILHSDAVRLDTGVGDSARDSGSGVASDYAASAVGEQRRTVVGRCVGHCSDDYACDASAHDGSAERDGEAHELVHGTQAVVQREAYAAAFEKQAACGGIVQHPPDWLGGSAREEEGQGGSTGLVFIPAFSASTSTRKAPQNQPV